MGKETGTKGTMAFNTTERFQARAGCFNRWSPTEGSLIIFANSLKRSQEKPFVGVRVISAREARRIKAIERALAPK